MLCSIVNDLMLFLHLYLHLLAVGMKMKMSWGLYYEINMLFFLGTKGVLVSVEKLRKHLFHFSSSILYSCLLFFPFFPVYLYIFILLGWGGGGCLALTHSRAGGSPIGYGVYCRRYGRLILFSLRPFLVVFLVIWAAGRVLARAV